jgi:RNA recognition motif-containing protein
MNNKLFVGGLSRETTEDSLREAFSQAGTVTSVWIKIDRDTGMPGGFGFVEMSTEAEAQAAIDMWNSKELGGRTLTVNVARPQTDRPRQGGYDRNRGGGYQRGGNKR